MPDTHQHVEKSKQSCCAYLRLCNCCSGERFNKWSIININYMLLRNSMLSLLRSLFYILLNASCVYWFQSKRQEICITPSVGGEKGAHKHLCSTVGSWYGINPSPKGNVYAWLFKYLLTDFAAAEICGKPHEKSSIMARRKSLSSTIPMSNKTTFSLPRSDISAVPSI